MIVNKLALGTAQFGINYGINNSSGIVSNNEIIKILNLAYTHGIHILDTAFNYGKSEETIGKLKEEKLDFNIISKYPDVNIEQSDTIINQTLKRLNQQKLYGYLFHNYGTFRKNPSLWKFFEELKALGKVEKIGFSLYYRSEIEEILNKNIPIDLIQIPYSILDQRFSCYFEELKNRGVEIHARSVFLQGLLFKPSCYFNNEFQKLKSKVDNLNSIGKYLNTNVADICLNFVRVNNYIDRIIVGVDNLKQLQNLIISERNISLIQNIYSQLISFEEKDENILVPMNWKKLL